MGEWVGGEVKGHVEILNINLLLSNDCPIRPYKVHMCGSECRGRAGCVLCGVNVIAYKAEEGFHACASVYATAR